MRVVVLARYPDEEERVEDLEQSEAVRLLHDGNARLPDDEPAPAAALAAGATPTFDPAGHTADEVTAYLAASAPAEQERVQAAEAAGKNRKTITGWQPTNGEG